MFAQICLSQYLDFLWWVYHAFSVKYARSRVCKIQFTPKAPPIVRYHKIHMIGAPKQLPDGAVCSVPALFVQIYLAQSGPRSAVGRAPDS